MLLSVGSDRRQRRRQGTEGFTGRSFYGRKKIRLEFPLNTKDRKAWGTWAEIHVYNIVVEKLVTPMDGHSFLLRSVLLYYVR